MFSQELFPEDTFYVCFAVDNRQEAELLYMFAKNRAFIRPLLGEYKGVKEVSFICQAEDFELATEFVSNQESILLLGNIRGSNHRKAYFLYNGDTAVPECIGYMGPASLKEAEKADGYSYAPDLDQFFIIRDAD